MTNLHPKAKKFINSFGRRSARGLTEKHLQALEAHQNIQLPQTLPKSFFTDLATATHSMLEIGFGMGDHTLGLAKHHQNSFIIAAETYHNGVASLTSKLHDASLTQEVHISNLRLYSEDSRFLLEQLPPASIDKAFLLFPDPWPKPRHFKRRLVNPHFIAEIHRILKPSGVIRIATDNLSYLEWILGQFSTHTHIFTKTLETTSFQTIPADHHPTKYQRIAEKKGLVGNFLEYTKV